MEFIPIFYSSGGDGAVESELDALGWLFLPCSDSVYLVDRVSCFIEGSFESF